jgi:2-methylfumaryl-CoA isomerase
VRSPLVRAPHLGEHTDLVLSEVLSMSSAQIGALHDAGIVSTARCAKS